MKETPQERLLEEQSVLDTLIVDRIYLEFVIEPEDYNIGFAKYNLAEDAHVFERMHEIALEAGGELAECVTRAQFPDSGPRDGLSDSDEQVCEGLQTPSEYDLNDRSSGLNLYSSDYVTYGLLDQNQSVEKHIGDENISRIKMQPTDIRFSDPVHLRAPQPPSYRKQKSGLGNPFR